MSVFHDLLPVATPDVYETLDIGWSGNLTLTGGKSQIVRYGVDNSRRVTGLGDSYVFRVSFNYDNLLPEKKETIQDLYLKKVDGRIKSFIWRGFDGDNKTDYHDYVVWFDSQLVVGIGPVMDSIGDILFSIKGKLSA